MRVTVGALSLPERLPNWHANESALETESPAVDQVGRVNVSLDRPKEVEGRLVELVDERVVAADLKMNGTELVHERGELTPQP